MPTDTPTPRTDAVAAKEFPTDNIEVLAGYGFARTLERELNEANTKLAYANDAAAKGEAGRNLGTALEECVKDRDAWKQCAKELAKVAEAADCDESYCEDCKRCKALTNFNKLKDKSV